MSYTARGPMLCMRIDGKAHAASRRQDGQNAYQLPCGGGV